MSHLFEPLKLRDIVLRNRIGIPPMCQYSASDGMAANWHYVHYGSRAVGGAALMIIEATAVTPEGRISPGDLGLWQDRQIEPLARIAQFAQEQGCVDMHILKRDILHPVLRENRTPYDKSQRRNARCRIA